MNLTQTICEWPSALHALIKTCPGYSGVLCPGSHAHDHAVMRNHSVIPAISPVYLSRGPLTVLGLVTTAIVFAVYLHSGSRPCSHVCDEILKLLPPLTDGYSSSAIAAVAIMLDVGASLQDAKPDMILRRLTEPVSALLAALALCRSTGANGWPENALNVPAVTPTDPVISASRETNNGPFFRLDSGSINRAVAYFHTLMMPSVFAGSNPQFTYCLKAVRIR